MKPVAIFRHFANEGPGYFATCLARQDIPWRLIKVDAEEPVPDDPRPFSGLVFMGGPMSVNDDLPWIRNVLALIQAGVDEGVPVLGHCLGGQLMAKALGGEVTRNPVKEIGWGRVDVADNAAAHDWFAHAPGSFTSFHWHGETFSIPPGATHVLSGPYCANQGFVMGKTLGMQCHVEMTEELIAAWCESGAREIARSRSPAVQTVDEIKSDMAARLEEMHRVADGLYARWLQGLKVD